MLDAEPPAAPEEALLNLVTEEQDTVLPAELIELADKFLRGRPHPSVALDRLDKNSCHGFRREICGKGLLDLLYVVLARWGRLPLIEIAEVADTRYGRTVAPAPIAIGQTGGGIGTAMIGALKADEIGFPGKCPRKLERRVVCIGPAVAKEHLDRNPAGIYRGQPLGVLHHGLVQRIAGAVLRTLFQLRHDRLTDCRVGAAQIQRGGA